MEVLNSSEKCSVYVHIPFCIRKCPYCDFVSVDYEPELASSYIGALDKECGYRIPDGLTATTLYIGGGTPTVLQPEQLERLFSVLLSHIRLAEDAEVTVEANPVTIDKAKTELLLDFGVNRISLGVQSFNDDRLRFLGRVHNAETAVETYRTLREAGFQNINIDIMFGLPNETYEGWAEDIRKTVSLAPEHISAYALTAEGGTPLHKRILSGDVRMPEEEVVAELMTKTIHLLSESGYEHYEVSNYAKDGYECRHNLTYWHYLPFFGIGASAVSFDGERRSKNTSDVATYIEKAGDCCLTEEEDRIDVRRRAEECFILALRLKEGLSEAVLLRRTGFSFKDFELSINHLREEGLLTLSDGCLRPTEKGFLFNDTIGTMVELGE